MKAHIDFTKRNAWKNFEHRTSTAFEDTIVNYIWLLESQIQDLQKQINMLKKEEEGK